MPQQAAGGRIAECTSPPPLPPAAAAALRAMLYVLSRRALVN